VQLQDVHEGHDPIEAVDAYLDVSALLSELPGRERQVAELRILQSREPDEIAATLGITRNNVDQVWHRAKKRLGLDAEAA
jgi:RNA polymerase sigma factor (sigma-70 family)